MYPPGNCGLFRPREDPPSASGEGEEEGGSGSLAWAPDDEVEAEVDPELVTGAQPVAEKRNTLDVGEVLSKNDALSDLERWERSKSKNRTLDNSDLQRLERARAAAAGPGAASEHRLLRFFSGIFARRDGGPSPRSGALRSRGYFSLRRAPADTHSSSAESIEGSPRRGWGLECAFAQMGVRWRVGWHSSLGPGLCYAVLENGRRSFGGH
ncbi:Arf-GAP, GTPase, ANK repeat and PH domain-containing protein 1/2/3 [Cricetulus griseus]|nr:Arf-GAP, GTPase, ANK repeat and PH domain-containing protein 1/2/3 [Cricetulus griseus]